MALERTDEPDSFLFEQRTMCCRKWRPSNATLGLKQSTKTEWHDYRVHGIVTTELELSMSTRITLRRTLSDTLHQQEVKALR